MDRLLQNIEDQAWTSIYVALVLTFAQIVLYVTIFECGRHSTKYKVVYDKARQVRSTPPPISNSWCFEWWRFRMDTGETDEESLVDDDNEHEDPSTDLPPMDSFVEQAEQILYEKEFHHWDEEKEETSTSLEDDVVPINNSIHLSEPEVSSQNGARARVSGNTMMVSGDEDNEELETPLQEGPDRRSGLSHTVSFGFRSSRTLKEDDECSDSSDEEGGAEESPPTISESVRDFALRFVVGKVQRRPLNDEDRKLLDCIGLDAFVTLRFLKFGLAISFWPLLLAWVVLVPAYTTASDQAGGYFSLTVSNLPDGSPRFWCLFAFAILQYTFVLQRLWVEWEIFIPLRYEFLEKKYGNVEKEKYHDQYRNTCLVEYVPRAFKLDKDLYDFFDMLFPGQINRAEVLLNTEELKELINARQRHIIAYEDVYASYIHRIARYLREKDHFDKHGYVERNCSRIHFIRPKMPNEPRLMATHPGAYEQARFGFSPTVSMEGNPSANEALPHHRRSILELNKLIDKEFLRLAQEQKRSREEKKKGFFLFNWFGRRYLTGSGSRRLHSSTAFVEFCSLTAKQQAIQCNITGTNKFMVVTPAPGYKEIIWDRAHVSRTLIDSRRTLANFILFLCLLGWSAAVTAIRAEPWFRKYHFENSTVRALLETYVPVLVIELLVRLFPFLIIWLAGWARFKAQSEIDLYELWWYFLFRLITFLFVIIGGSITDSAGSFVQDPVGFVKRISENVSEQSQYFIDYVIISIGVSFFYLSQVHNVAMFWFVEKIITKEAMSSRRLERMRTNVKELNTAGLFPYFLFVAMVSLLYGVLAPMSNIFVAVFFLLSYKVLRFMAVFVYGKAYEGGGRVFYTLSLIIFILLYLMISLVAGYLALYSQSPGMSWSFFLIMIIVTATTHVTVWATFVAPSRTLALTKARLSDDGQCASVLRLRRRREFLKAKAALLELEKAESLLTDEEGGAMTEKQKRQEALRRMERRYPESLDTLASNDFFIYRPPSMNHVTWELSPRPYRALRRYGGSQRKAPSVLDEEEDAESSISA